MSDKGVKLSEDFAQRTARVVREAEAARTAGPRTPTGQRHTPVPGGASAWVIVREVAGPNALWAWVEPAHPAENYANPGHADYGVYVGFGPPQDPREKRAGESDEDYARYLKGWVKVAVWPGTNGSYFEQSIWPEGAATTRRTDILEAKIVATDWHVKPQLETIPRFAIPPGTNVGDCGTFLRGA